jgi:hypothetical protein
MTATSQARDPHALAQYSTATFSIWPRPAAQPTLPSIGWIVGGGLVELKSLTHSGLT